MAVVNFVMKYYIWFLIGIILILLAIIGAYADKTNFGQGKKDETDKKENTDNTLKNVKLGEVVGQNSSSVNKDALNVPESEPHKLESEGSAGDQTSIQQNNIENTKSETIENNSNNAISVEKTEIKENKSNPTLNGVSNISSSSLNIEDKLNKLNEEINDILPEKELIDSSLLEDVGDMSLDYKEKNVFDEKNDFNFDDLKLPEIKKPKKEIEDVWKK